MLEGGTESVKTLQQPSGDVETRRAAAVTVDFRMNAPERGFLEQFFKLLDAWDSEESSGNPDPS